MSEAYRDYANVLENGLAKLYKISDKARQMGLDPSLTTECMIAKDLADLVEGLVGPAGVAASIRELSSKLPREELAFKITEEIVYGKFGHMEPQVAADQAIRTALAILTEGLTAAPLQGIARVSIKANNDRTHYLAVYFAGPMRSAGGTDQALTLVVGDFVRRLLGLDRYKPTDDETSRFIEELRLYQRTVTRFQYHVSDEELRKALQLLPIEVTGTESDPIEVSTFRNLPRIETNRVRGGALRVVNDGIVGRAQKVYGVIEKLGIQGWDWLRDFHKKSEQNSAGFMDEVIAGRPIFSFPSCKGGFRLRYGRARNTGLSAVGIHPLTMFVLQDFLAGGTQVRLELPGKGGVVVPVDSIEPPIVRLKDGSVLRISPDCRPYVKDKIDKILFLGDMLISFGDFLYNNRSLEPSGYVEEWWSADVKESIVMKLGGNFEKASEITNIPLERFVNFLNNPFSCKPRISEAVAISKVLHVPLHPSFTFFWSNITSLEEITHLRSWLLTSEVTRESEIVASILGNQDLTVKKTLEDICVPHKIAKEMIAIEGEDAAALALCLGYENMEQKDYSRAKNTLDLVCLFSGVEVREKAPTFIGARMGRPEKAKRREMKPLVHVLFPIGLSGGSQRDISEAAKKPPSFVDIIKRKCVRCKTFTTKILCPNCGSETLMEKYCPKCGKTLKEDECPSCRIHTVCYQRQVVNFKESLTNVCNRLGVSVPKPLKGVKSLTNETKTPEILEKGILRAEHELSVYKDGTVRFDATNAPITHFKPCEISVTVEKLRDLGYTCDINGNELMEASQTCELRIQDLIIPFKCGEYFVKIANFVDELLVQCYKTQPYYEAKKPEDIVGHLVVGLAPHTCAGILGRVIGFTKLNLCYAHPIWHSAKRRDCDGDEDAIMLALDVLLNFSRKYLPAQIGGIMDAPILLIPIVKTKDVQRQAHDFDVANNYSVEFYEKTLEKTDAKRVSSVVDLVAHRLDTQAQFEGFNYTTPVSDINAGNLESAYKKFKTMLEKLDNQLKLAEMIEAVDARRVAFKVLTTHFIKDISGNLRAFSTQSFRCKSCSKRFRRLPLVGKCTVCGGQLTLTVYRGSIEKYLVAAQKLIESYKLPNYYAQRVELLKDEIETLFAAKKQKQISLTDFA